MHRHQLVSGLCADWRSSVYQSGNSRNVSLVCYGVSVTSSWGKGLLNWCLQSRVIWFMVVIATECMTVAIRLTFAIQWKCIIWGEKGTSSTSKLHAVNFHFKMFFVRVCVCQCETDRKTAKSLQQPVTKLTSFFFSKHSGQNRQDSSS